MRITKCDICKRIIKGWDDGASLQIGTAKSVDLCIPCSKPLSGFLEKHGLEKVKTKIK